MSWSDSLPLVIIVGPTAVGKTELAINLAERLGGEVVSADSRLFYRGMDIGTAKPGWNDLQRVRHHLIDVADPSESWSLALFKEKAHQAIEDIHQRGKLPFLAGGTGQYIRAVIEGWEMPSQAPDARIRKALEDWAGEIGANTLHRKLALLDPEAAEIIDPSNVRRIVRALEVIFWTGRRFSQQRRQKAPPYRVLIVGLTRPRTELYSRIDQRIDRMIQDGLIEETQTLLKAGYSSDLPALSAIGYREIIFYLNNQIPLEEAILLIKRKTRNFVRRQANWFKPDALNIRWFTAGENTLDETEQYIRFWLRTG